MNILARISQLFKADIHGILDSLEQPEIILQQSIRDMQNELDKAEIILSELDEQRSTLEKKQHNLDANIIDLQEQLQFCLSEKNELLAKSVIRKKLQTDLILKECSRKLANVIEEKKHKSHETDERKEKLNAIRDKLTLFTEKTEYKESTLSADVGNSISQDDIELAFLYEKKCYATKTHSNGESL